MKKLVCLALALVLLLAACSSAADKIDPEYYEVGKQALAVAEAYLADRIDLEEAKERIEKVKDDLDELPLIPEKDATYQQSDKVALYVDAIYYAFAFQESTKWTIQLHEDLQKYVEYLGKTIGLAD